VKSRRTRSGAAGASMPLGLPLGRRTCGDPLDAEVAHQPGDALRAHADRVVVGELRLDARRAVDAPRGLVDRLDALGEGGVGQGPGRRPAALPGVVARTLMHRACGRPGRRRGVASPPRSIGLPSEEKRGLAEDLPLFFEDA